MATHFNVPTTEEVSEGNKAIFSNLEKGLGFVPNLYATFAYNDTALGDYLTLQNRKSTLTAKEREVINLVVSQVNECNYCLAAHTALAKNLKFSDEEILSIRTGELPGNQKLNALAGLVKEIARNRGTVSEDKLDAFFAEGYTKANLVDVIIVIGDKIISNYLHKTTRVPVDFPAAPALETQPA
ncbi:carboxymuconolactone decarboxylase family protein [Roseivirga sp. BDSF3-8]|uniref:carboxymuconolactone decarboxylase family protein n=1 Tax=Roseivirga sp. BDSF3-8 TaxID=3241598 RepID=UPI003532716D